MSSRKIIGVRKIGIVIVIIFIIGFYFGVIFSFESSYKHRNKQRYIPSPHTFRKHSSIANGTSTIDRRHSKDTQKKDESDAVANALFEKVRVLCWVMTQPSNHDKKARHVKETWGKRCNILIFVSTDYDESLPTVVLDVDKESRHYLWRKTRQAFQYVYDNYLDQADWFMRADDDTYVIMENLRYFLSNKDTNQPVFYGRHFKRLVNNGYMSGGAGTVLSKEALKRLITITNIENLDDFCSAKDTWTDDVMIGECLMNAGVLPGDSRDELQRERFMPINVEGLLLPNHAPKWLEEYDFYPTKEGPECCSDYAISFHYVSGDLMHALDYLIYRLKPYGRNNEQFLENNSNSSKF